MHSVVARIPLFGTDIELSYIAHDMALPEHQGSADPQSEHGFTDLYGSYGYIEEGAGASDLKHREPCQVVLAIPQTRLASPFH